MYAARVEAAAVSPSWTCAYTHVYVYVVVMGEGQAIRTPEGAHPRMDADEEARFLAAAFKFLAEISYGEPVDGARPPSITSG